MSNISLNHWDVNEFRSLQITKYIHMYINLDVTGNLSKGGLMLIHFQAKRVYSQEELPYAAKFFCFIYSMHPNLS